MKIEEVLQSLFIVLLVAASVVTLIVYFKDFILPWKNRLIDKLRNRSKVEKRINLQRIVSLALLLLLIYIVLLLIYLLPRIYSKT